MTKITWNKQGVRLVNGRPESLLDVGDPVPREEDLQMYDRLTLERDTLDKRRVEQLVELSQELVDVLAVMKDLLTTLGDVVPDMFPDQQALVLAMVERANVVLNKRGN